MKMMMTNSGHASYMCKRVMAFPQAHMKGFSNAAANRGFASSFMTINHIFFFRKNVLYYTPHSSRHTHKQQKIILYIQITIYLAIYECKR